MNFEVPSKVFRDSKSPSLCLHGHSVPKYESVYELAHFRCVPLPSDLVQTTSAHGYQTCLPFSSLPCSVDKGKTIFQINFQFVWLLFALCEMIAANKHEVLVHALQEF